MANTHQITDLNDIRKIVNGGNSTFTLVSKATSARYTFKISAPLEQRRSTEEFQTLFVSLLNGPDNWSNYTNIGYLKPQVSGLKYNHSRKSRVGVDAASVKAIGWFLSMLQSANADKLGMVEFWHEGKCARCGRKLTVPESIQSGFGPECVNLVGSVRIERPRPAESEREMQTLEAAGDRAQTVREDASSYAVEQLRERYAV